MIKLSDGIREALARNSMKRDAPLIRNETLEAFGMGVRAWKHLTKWYKYLYYFAPEASEVTSKSQLISNQACLSTFKLLVGVSECIKASLSLK